MIKKIDFMLTIYPKGANKLKMTYSLQELAVKLEI